MNEYINEQEVDYYESGEPFDAEAAFEFHFGVGWDV